jgi:two-component system sensor histidine kinase KdpD
MDEHRPDPDALLAAIQREAARQQRGRLKIFFGMAAGVGKTYAMLEAAQARQAEGVDVVVGCVETHGRAETEQLLARLEQTPRRTVEHRGAQLQEMDLDAILARAPQLVLIDELAHTNAPGSRHLKRYQDVLELLGAGIDVYTTVNVQHFESRADAVRQITGIAVLEKAPDSLLDMADEIELIDLPPADLRKRLAEGKVYTADRADVAAHNFFRVGNLTALREMALRLTAEHVDHKLQDYMQVKQIAGPWKSGERLMVAVSPSPFSAEVIRWTRRIAYNLEAPWFAAFIETSAGLSPAQRELLAQNLELVRRLGGEVVTAAGEDIVAALLRLAQQRNVTQIVIGKPLQPRRSDWLRGGSLVDRLIRAGSDIDIYVVSGQRGGRAPVRRPPLPPFQPQSTWRDYAWALAAVAAITAGLLAAHSLWPWISYQAVGLIELLAVLLIAVYLGRGPALLAALASAVSWNFLFMQPRFTFEIAALEDIILFLLYFVIALFAGTLTARLRTRERQAQHNADRTTALYALAHETATAVDMDDVLRTAVEQIGRAFDAAVAILLTRDGKLARTPHPASTLPIDERELAVAIWVFDNNQPAGRFTATLPEAASQFRPLATANRTVGVVGIRPQQPGRLSFDQEVLLEMFTSQVALVIERELLDEAAEEAEMLRESERLYTTLLNSISHELRTPIATIAGAASSLLDPNTALHEQARSELTGEIQTAADRLNRLVENLLDMSRLDAGRLQLKLEWCDVGDVIGVALAALRNVIAGRAVQVTVAPDAPLVKLDFVLMEQVIVNLVDNACAYTPAGSPLAIDVRAEEGWIRIDLADCGPGIPPAALERIFDKFYRAPGTAAGGTGLGLSICRGLVEAHGGELTAQNRPEGGALFTVRLPQRAAPPPVKEAAL